MAVCLTCPVCGYVAPPAEHAQTGYPPERCPRCSRRSLESEVYAAEHGHLIRPRDRALDEIRAALVSESFGLPA